ncbi:MAG: BlaI/MecI/CopY family transcriptional regulator [Verrucomicrobiota bacterium]
MTQERKDLSRREREILDLLFSLGEATSAQIRAHMDNPPSGNSVRTHLQILEDRGEIVRDRKEGREFIYKPKEARQKAGMRALSHVLETFFEGSVSTALAAHLAKGEFVDEDEYQRLRTLIEEHTHPQSDKHS